MPDARVPPVLVCGAGAWGTAFAIHLARRAPQGVVSLWARDADQARQMAALRVNSRYLPDAPLPPGLHVAAHLGQVLQIWREQTALERLGLLVLACPVSALRDLAHEVAQFLGVPAEGEGVLWLSKGLVVEGSNGHGFQWPSDLVSSELRGWPMGALSGPSFAKEVAAGLPVALTLASAQADWAREIAARLFGGGMRIYSSTDLIGVQLGGAVKNVLAIAAGVADSLSLGANARAALITRGLAETARLGLSLGAQPETFLGLATLGDLVLTATGDLSRNRRVGMGLGQGRPLAEILGELGHVAEGVQAAPALLALARHHEVECPIIEAVCALLDGRLTPSQAISGLLSRHPIDERP
ncbi:MAG: NAD(P)-dependent glycerol-3-phosphate dehydrogenase [Betaproteobacteria bacterium]|nr:NAD(P)-dependent glycerol-3-phosphate dehydrogenase [Betaproteobacteria bacterium]